MYSHGSPREDWIVILNKPDRAEDAAEEGEDNAINVVEETGHTQRLEGLCDLDKHALHLINVLHTPHKAGQV